MPRIAPATLALVVASALVFAAMKFFPAESVIRPLLISAYTRPMLPEIFGGQWWRLLTPIFLHFGLFHLVFNLLWVWELGRLIEYRHGAPALIIITAIIAALSNVIQYFAAGPAFGGTSGVLYGYFGYVWIQGKFNPAFGARLAPQVVTLLLAWFFICWSGVLKLFNLHVANAAHTGGLIAGVAIAAACIAVTSIAAKSRARNHF